MPFRMQTALLSYVTDYIAEKSMKVRIPFVLKGYIRRSLSTLKKISRKEHTICFVNIAKIL